VVKEYKGVRGGGGTWGIYRRKRDMWGFMRKKNRLLGKCEAGRITNKSWKQQKVGGGWGLTPVGNEFNSVDATKGKRGNP